MSEQTPRTGLPEIEAAQAQKHVTHNAALQKLDALFAGVILDRDLTSPPGSPADGDAYLIAASATGDWAGHDGDIAYARDGVWTFYEVFDGLMLLVDDEGGVIVRRSGAWVDLNSAIGALQNLPLVGINTTADATNKLAVRSAAVLHTAIYAADGGSGDVQHKLNKEAAGDTASFLFQTNFSGRAEVGLTGDDDFHFKVSPDGSSWHEAIVLDKDDGQAKFVAGSVSAPGVAVGEVGTGLYLSSSGNLRIAAGGVEAVRINQFGIGVGDDPISAISLAFAKTGGGTNQFRFDGEGTTALIARRFSNDSQAAFWAVRKARGTIAAPAVVQSGDGLGIIFLSAHTGSAFVTAAEIGAVAKAATPSTTDMETRLYFNLCPAGSVTSTEALRLEYSTGLSMYGANVVINQNRHFRKRQYAAGSLPAQNSGDEIASSDIVAATLVSDGTQWTSPGVKVNAVTANTTISIPAGWAIDQVHFANTTANAVTGGIKIGTTSGATDVVAAQAVGANALDTIADANVLKKVFSRSVAQTLFIQAVTAWNSASLELSFVLRKVF
jgi:hypothetical protein